MAVPITFCILEAPTLAGLVHSPFADGRLRQSEQKDPAAEDINQKDCKNL